MHPFVATLNGWLRRVPVWPGYILGFIPAAWLLWMGINNNLGANPVKTLEHELGEIALQLIVAGLVVTPLMHLTRINLIRFRRLIGLMAFYYVLLHFATYLVLDLQLAWDKVIADVTKRPYIIVGTLAMVMMLPLALTSNDWAIRTLGSARWCRLHTLIYPAAILSAVHYVWLVKAWPLEPFVYLAAMVVLVAYRPLRKWSRNRTRVVAAG